MKTIKYIFLTLFMCFGILLKVNAISIQLLGSSRVAIGNSAKVQMLFNSSYSSPVSSTITINYDSSLFNFSNVVTNNNNLVCSGSNSGNVVTISCDFDNTVNSLLTINFSTGKGVGTGAFNISIVGADPSQVTKSIEVFTPSSNANLASLSLSQGSLSPAFNANTTNYNAVVDNSYVTVTATSEDSNASVSSKSKKVNLSYGDNNYSVTVTAENGTKKIYNIKITRPDNRNTSSYLKNISLSSGSLSFSKTKTSYEVSVPSNISSVTINGIKEYDKQSISYPNGQTVYLNEGENKKVIIHVTAENGSTKDYQVTIKREKGENQNQNNNSSTSTETQTEKQIEPQIPTNTNPKGTDCTLKILNISNVNIKFNKDATLYFVQVDNKISNITVSAVATDSKATVTGMGKYNLKVGDNKITIKVVSEDKKNIYYYIVTIRRAEEVKKIDNKKSDDNYLSIIKVIGTDKTNYLKDFDKNILEYTVEIPWNELSILTDYELNSDKATVEVTESGDLSQNNYEVMIVVTAENGTTRVYKIHYIEVGEKIEEYDISEIEKILESINKTPNDDIYITGVNINENVFVNKDIVTALAKNHKRLVFLYNDDYCIGKVYFSVNESNNAKDTNFILNVNDKLKKHKTIINGKNSGISFSTDNSDINFEISVCYHNILEHNKTVNVYIYENGDYKLIDNSYLNKNDDDVYLPINGTEENWIIEVPTKAKSTKKDTKKFDIKKIAIGITIGVSAGAITGIIIIKGKNKQQK